MVERLIEEMMLTLAVNSQRLSHIWSRRCRCRSRGFESRSWPLKKFSGACIRGSWDCPANVMIISSIHLFAKAIEIRLVFQSLYRKVKLSLNPHPFLEVNDCFIDRKIATSSQRCTGTLASVPLAAPEYNALIMTYCSNRNCERTHKRGIMCL